MLLYVFVAVFPLLVGYIYFKKVLETTPVQNQQTKKFIRKRFWWLMLAAFPMFLLIAIRSGRMGADAGTYQRFFEEMVDTPWSEIFGDERLEPGFLIFEKLLTYITSSALIYQCICALICMVAVVDFANRLNCFQFSYLYFFATMGIYTFMFTGLRQCLAMCICLFSYRFVQNKKILKFALCVTLAFFFHKSAVLFAAVYLIYNRKIRPLNLLIYAILGVLAFLNIDVIQEWFNDQLDYSYEIEETEGGFIFTIVVAVITIFAIIMISNFKKMTVSSRGMINVSFIALLLWVLRIATRVAERPSYYFLFFTIGMLCYGIEAPGKQSDRWFYKAMVYGAMMALFVYRMYTNFSSLVPFEIYG